VAAAGAPGARARGPPRAPPPPRGVAAVAPAAAAAAVSCSLGLIPSMCAGGAAGSAPRRARGGPHRAVLCCAREPTPQLPILALLGFEKSKGAGGRAADAAVRDGSVRGLMGFRGEPAAPRPGPDVARGYTGVSHILAPSGAARRPAERFERERRLQAARGVARAERETVVLLRRRAGGGPEACVRCRDSQEGQGCAGGGVHAAAPPRRAWAWSRAWPGEGGGAGPRAAGRAAPCLAGDPHPPTCISRHSSSSSSSSSRSAAARAAGGSHPP
jgi:hypothetical protein